MPRRPPYLPALLLAAALAWLPASLPAASEPVTAAALRHWPPQYRMEDGRPSGFAIDVMDAVAQRAGVAVDYRVFDTFPEAVAALREGRVDVIPNMGITPQREAFARFTVPVETFRVVWFVRSASTVDDLDDLRGRPVGVVEANVAKSLLAPADGIEVRTFPSLEEAVFALLDGQLAALVYPRPVVEKLLRDSGLAARVRVVGEPLVEIRRGIAVRADRPALHRRLDAAANAFVGSADYRRLYSRWYGAPAPWWTPQRVAWAMGGLLTLAILGMAAWRYRTVVRFNRRLQREMAGRREAEAASRLAARAMDEAAEGVAITDADGRVRQVNQAFTRLTGFEAEEARGRRLADLQEGFPGFPGEAAGSAGHWQGEVRARRRDGEPFPVWQTVSAVRDEAGAVSHFVIIFNDISDLKASQEELERLAHRDALTGLPNRLLFNERLEQALRRGRRQGSGLAVLFLDLDGFKHVNDAFGHFVGDELLQAVAERLRAGLRETDTLARMGGDEFILLVERLEASEDAAVVAQKALDRLAPPFELHGHNLSLEASIGISLYPDHGGDVPTLIKNADAAMYRAKGSGRNRYRFFTPELAVKAAERLDLQEVVARSLDNGLAELAYWPVVSTADAAVIGLEAAPRVPHPERGLVGPQVFLPAVQDTRLMARLADWALEAACRQVVAWREAGLTPGRMVVRADAAQIEHGGLVDRVRAVLAETGLPAGVLEVDLPEVVLGRHSRRLAADLEPGPDPGARWVVSEFGSAGCSLGTLRELPLGGFKVAPRFVQAAPENGYDRRMLEAVVAMGSHLGMSVAAEGVETAEQLEAVRAAGCAEAQGPYLHPPLGTEAATELLRGKPG